MADAKKLIPIIKRWEGGYSNHPLDKGGPTMQGITLVTFQKYYGADKTAEDLKNITEAQWFHIFKEGYWDPFRADDMLSQSIANLVVDWAWGSGPVTAIKKVQKQLGVYTDGKVGPITLAAINTVMIPITVPLMIPIRLSLKTGIFPHSPPMTYLMR